jgi:hypothetical protein
MAVVGTSTTTASTARLRSKRHAKYRSGLGGVQRFTTLFTAPVADTEQYIGIMDESGSTAAFKNGFSIGYDGTTFGFHRFSNDVKITVPLADWDDPLDGSGRSRMVLDPTKLNVFFIQYQYLGAGAITIWAEDEATGNLIVVHRVLYANLNTTPSVENPNFHFTMWVDNKATTSNLIIKSSSYAYFIEGKTTYLELHQPKFATGEQSSAGVTTDTAIFTIRNKATYTSKTNFIDVFLESIAGSIEASSANNLGSIRLVRNATLGGTPSFSDISTTDSVVEIDTAGTTVTGGRELFSFPLAGKNDSVSVNLSDFNIIIAPGETMTMVGNSQNSATIKGSTFWKELF